MPQPSIRSDPAGTGFPRHRFLASAMRLLALPVFFCGFITMAVAQDWPYPGDIPDVGPVAPGLAGENPTDIVRYLMVRGIGGAALSPDGKTLAFTSTVTGIPQIWTVPAKGGWPHQITFGAAVTEFHWLPPSDEDWPSLLYAADRNGDEREAYWQISADGRAERQILDHSEAYRNFGSFSPDGKRFIYASTARNGTDFDLYVANRLTGESRMVHQGRFGFYAGPWQPGGSSVIISEIRGEDGNDLHLLNVDDGAFQTLFSPEISAYYGTFQWRPDGAGFYLISDHERNFKGLAYYDLASRSLDWIETPDHDVDDLALSHDGRYLIWTVNDGGTSKLYARDLAQNEMIESPALPAGVYGIDFADRASVLSVRVSAPDIPGAVYSWSLPDGAFAHAARAELAGIDPRTLVAPQSVYFKARDGVMLHGLLYLPAKSPDGVKPPVVIDVHGGPTAQARPTFSGVTQYLLGRGVAVLDVNVRGSTGFGKHYARLDNQRKRPDSVRDLVDALAFLKEDGRVDADRAAVMGGSYGGYMVNAVLGSYPDAFKAGVSFVGVSDWVRALEEASPALKASDRLEYGDINDPDDRAFFAELSPITRADQIKVPMFVQHGANDPRDPVTESDRLVKALRANGLPVIYMRFSDEGHGVRKLNNRVALYRAVAQFLEQHLGVE
ncbi:dipeptidyl peptidase family member 6 [alpha proteobacterium Q-1]|nr:S9 family peptidase [Iodidimonas nitroreducens]GAK33031.1 dipeptidyl peptidase family member 6 [alpha proteobacterium Q-1]